MHFRSFVSLAAIAFSPLLAAHCAIDEAPRGLRATPDGSGPEIVFDLMRRPLPEIPAPNDVATVADPTSRTGRRINVSLLSPTSMESKARTGFGEMEGWGTFAPITVAFTREAGADPAKPAIDLEDIASRMQGDGYDFKNDPAYLINLKTGVPIPLDMGNGHFLTPMRDTDAYWANDPKVRENSIIYETQEEAPGAPQAAYTPALDMDFDGVLDHPNTLHPALPGQVEGVDNLLTWYERETDTLILRPIIPMDEMTEYAVVLTDRLHGADGQPVKSPFPFVHHPEQKQSVAKVQAILADSSRARFYGDMAGTGLDHVAFAWTFTTEPTYEDMKVLRNGLYGRGPFARFATDFPAKAEALRAVGLTSSLENEPADLGANPVCAPLVHAPFIVNVDTAKDTLHRMVQQILGLNDVDAAALQKELLYVDHLVIGRFKSPYLLSSDPAHENADEWFHVNFQTGEGRVASDDVTFWLAVPKTTATAHQPFPTVMWSHGTSLFAPEILPRAGYFAAQGIATFGINMPGHGLYMDQGQQDLVTVLLRNTCMVEWINAVTAGRSHDLNGDGIADSGGFLWTSHIFHSRDAIRQSVLDQMQAVRVLQGFDGKTRTDQDFNGDGQPDLAGDFDGDGTPDVGAGTKVFTAGNSYGGIVAMVHGALDPFVTASAPISGGGGLIDVAARSSLVPTSVIEQIMTPLLVAVPASERGQGTDTSSTQCAAGQSSVRLVVNDLLDSKELEIACLTPEELGPKMTVLFTNLRNHERRCARTGDGGRVRVSIPADVGDRLDVQIFNAPDVVDSYKTCLVNDGAPVGRHISTWEQPATAFTQTDNDASCTADAGCQQFRNVFYEVGSPLVSPNEGLGIGRQTPELRRLFTLTQAAIDPADPINYAASYMLRPLPGLDGENLGPRPILVSNTVGDPFVPVQAGNAFARAAGVLPFFPPSALATVPEYADFVTPQAIYDANQMTPDEVLIKNHVIAGLSRLGYTHGGPACTQNYTSPPTFPGCGPTPAVNPNTCGETLFDADWNSEGADHYDAPHPTVPLRLARLIGTRATDAASLAQSWSPRIAVLSPTAPDSDGWNAPAMGLVNAYINPLGQHVWVTSDPCKAFDDARYFDNMMIRFLATSGQDIYFLSHPRTHLCMATESCPFDP